MASCGTRSTGESMQTSRCATEPRSRTDSLPLTPRSRSSHEFNQAPPYGCSATPGVPRDDRGGPHGEIPSAGLPPVPFGELGVAGGGERCGHGGADVVWRRRTVDELTQAVGAGRPAWLRHVSILAANANRVRTRVELVAGSGSGRQPQPVLG